MSVPPVDRAPYGTQLSLAKQLTSAHNNPDVRSRVARWNARLQDFVTIFRFHHSDAFISIYYTSEIFNAVLDDPGKYGFRDAVSICQSGECVWNDVVHPVFSMHKLIAEDLANYLVRMGKGWAEVFG